MYICSRAIESKRYLVFELLTNLFLYCYKFAVGEPDEMEKMPIAYFSTPTRTNKFWKR